MTTEQRKELKDRFIELWEGRTIDPDKTWIDNVFDFFYSEIENRDEQIEYHAGLSLKNANAVRELQTKLQRLEEIIKAADEVVQRGYSPGSVDTSGFGENDKYYEALEHYNKLKSKT